MRVAALALAFVLSCRAEPASPPSPPVETPAAPSAAAQARVASPVVTLPDFAELAARVVPAVVKVQVQQKVAGPRGPMDPFDFFHPMAPGERRRGLERSGLGSGFFIAPKGLILTNAHVVEGADRIEVSFALPDGGEKKLAAKVVGQAPDYDVALLETDGDAKAPVIPLGNSDEVRIGDWVMAVGNPFGLEHSVSVGIISAKQRRDIAPSGRQGLYDFMQTDASINPGNSGGPLVSTRGEVVGINSAVNAQGQGIGFAIPINMVKEMLPQLERGGRYVRSWVGVKIQPLTEELAQSYGLPDARGVLVAEVVAESPAAKAGVAEGDVILEFDGKKLNRSSDLPLFASMAGVGKKVPLVLWHDGKTRTVQVTLEAFPDEARLAAAEKEGEGQGDATLGLRVRDLTDEMRERLSVSARRGAVITEVEPGSAAAKAGLAPGDVIVEADGERVGSAADLSRVLRDKPKGALVRLRLEREGTRIFTAMRK